MVSATNRNVAASPGSPEYALHGEKVVIDGARSRPFLFDLVFVERPKQNFVTVYSHSLPAAQQATRAEDHTHEWAREYAECCGLMPYCDKTNFGAIGDEASHVLLNLTADMYVAQFNVGLTRFCNDDLSTLLMKGWDVDPDDDTVQLEFDYEKARRCIENVPAIAIVDAHVRDYAPVRIIGRDKWAEILSKAQRQLREDEADAAHGAAHAHAATHAGADDAAAYRGLTAPPPPGMAWHPPPGTRYAAAPAPPQPPAGPPPPPPPPGFPPIPAALRHAGWRATGAAAVHAPMLAAAPPAGALVVANGAAGVLGAPAPAARVAPAPADAALAPAAASPPALLAHAAAPAVLGAPLDDVNAATGGGAAGSSAARRAPPPSPIAFDLDDGELPPPPRKRPAPPPAPREEDDDVGDGFFSTFDVMNEKVESALRASTSDRAHEHLVRRHVRTAMAALDAAALASRTQADVTQTIIANLHHMADEKACGWSTAASELRRAVNNIVRAIDAYATPPRARRAA